MKRSLFEDQELFNDINEEDVRFPLFFKNRYNNIFTRYPDKDKFEQITISKANESLRGDILFGFNELIHELHGDLKMWFYLIYRNQVQITVEEYETVFNSVILGREEFFNGETYQYIERLPLSDKPCKHKWKSAY